MAMLSIGILAALIIGCGSEDDGESAPGGSAPVSEPAPTEECDCGLSDADVLATVAAEAAGTPAPPAVDTTGLTADALSVSIVDFDFRPPELSIVAGDQVKIALRNAGDLPHTFTITDVVDSGSLSGGESRQMQFTAAQAGTFTYFCTVHGRETMSGTLTVKAAP